MSYWRPACRARDAMARALVGMRDARGRWRRPAPSASRRGTIHAVTSRSRMSSRPSASVATIALPIASVSNAVSGVPSHSDGKTLRSNAESVSATSFWKPRNTNRSPSPSAFAWASSGSRNGPSPARKNLARGCARDDLGGGLDEELVPLRVVQPRDGANGEVVGRGADGCPGRGQFRRRFSAGRTPRAARRDTRP